MQKIDGSQLISEITLDDLQKAVGGSTSFCACVHKLRKMSGFSFVILRTGRYILQSVYSKDKCTGDFDSLCEGAYIKITGDVKEEKRANHGYEITLSSLKYFQNLQRNTLSRFKQKAWLFNRNFNGTQKCRTSSP